MFAEQEAKFDSALKTTVASPSRKKSESLLLDVDQLTLELQATIGSLKSKLDAFSAKVDSIDLSYDKRISNLESTFGPLLQTFDRLPSMSKVHDHI